LLDHLGEGQAPMLVPINSMLIRGSEPVVVDTGLPELRDEYFETLFSLDGLGLLSYESVIRRDYPVVLGTLYLFTLIGLVTKLISDLCYVWVDPRVKFD
jgi:hypothetical protein